MHLTDARGGDGEVGPRGEHPLGIGLVVLQTIRPSNNPMLQIHTAGGLPESSVRPRVILLLGLLPTLSRGGLADALGAAANHGLLVA